MFFPVESLRRGGRFYLCWVADSWPLRFATITHRQLWSQDIREIWYNFNDLLEVMRNESGRPTNRFSLRLSSQLLRGLVRLYQRKVTIFVGDICMINAHVMKSTHKKSNYEESDPVMKSLELPRFILDIQPEEEAGVEKIQNNENIVAHIEDITLRETIVPEKRVALDDGFGELNPDRPMQPMSGERSVEMMLFKETSAQLSALDLLLDFSTDKSHDRSRLNPREARMERLTEHDLTVFGKSAGEAPALRDYEKEIPEIPEVPHPDLPHPDLKHPDIQHPDLPHPDLPHPDLPHPDPPHTDKELEKVEKSERARAEPQPEVSPATALGTEHASYTTLRELEDEPPVKRRKLRNKLIIDKSIKLSTDYMRSRIDAAAAAPAGARAPAPRARADWTDPQHPLLPPIGPLAGPLASGARPLGAALAALQRSRLERLLARAGETRGPQEAVLKKTQHSDVRSILETIDEEAEAADAHEGNLAMRDVSERMDVAPAAPQGSPTRGPAEPAETMTQTPPETWQAEKRPSEQQQSPKRRRGGVACCGRGRRRGAEAPPETSKESVPRGRGDTLRLSALLRRDGLADSEQARAPGGEGAPPARSDASETPLGSLDRTKVSLGDSDVTTDSKKFIREEWGTQGTMHKIYRCIKSSAARVDVDALVSAGPVLAGRRRLIAARCFTSILKLKQHGFIRIYKDSETNEIKDIKFGSKIINDE